MTREHHVPVSWGFNRGIPAELIASPENVTYTTWNANLTKFTRLDDRAKRNLKAWGYEHLLK